MKTHQKVYEIGEEIRLEKQVRETREEQEREGLPLEYCNTNIPDALNQEETEEEEEEDMFKDYQSHQKKIERGKWITAIIKKGPICEGSL